MKSIPYERPPDDVVPRNEPPRFHFPLALSSAPGLRSSGARRPAILPVFSTTTGRHLVVMRMRRADMAARPIGSISSSPAPTTAPSWSTSPRSSEAARLERAGRRAGQGMPTARSPCATSSTAIGFSTQKKLRYGFYLWPLGERVRVLVALDEWFVTNLTHRRRRSFGRSCAFPPLSQWLLVHSEFIALHFG
ncbi:hypothetical protein FHX03_006482 [Rhizobium sp. BK456]|nr:hypothetical protein [Rhizobium sp. BK456]